MQQNVPIPKSVRKSLGMDSKKSGSAKRSKSSSRIDDKSSSSPSRFFSSLTSRASLADFKRSRSKEFSSSGVSEASSRLFVKDAGSTPPRMRSASSRRSVSRRSVRSSGKENRFRKSRSSPAFGASLDIHTITGKAAEGAEEKKAAPARVCQLLSENMFCISGMSALTINTPPSAYRKMAMGNHAMITRSMTKSGTKSMAKTKPSDKNKTDLDISVYDTSPSKGGVRKRLSLMDSSFSSCKDGAGDGPVEPEGDSNLSRGPSARPLRRNTVLRDSQLNVTVTSLHSILEDREEIMPPSARKRSRFSVKNRSAVSAAAVPFHNFITPSTKLRKSAKQRNVSSTSTCSRRDRKLQKTPDRKLPETPEQPPEVKATVKRSKSVSFSNKKEYAAVIRSSANEKRQRAVSLRGKPVCASKESVRVEMRENAGHTPKMARKKQEPYDERLI